jgi:NAD-dependent DNA ligase
VCITGTLDMTRKDLQSILEDKGYTVTSTVTKDCYALIFNGETSSSKYKKAVQNGVQTIDYWKNKKDILNGLI